MANTSAQKEAELWIVNHYLPSLFNGLVFEERRIELTWGGKFAFDAVSRDRSIIGLISTSAAKTKSGKQAAAKIQKLKCDTLYLSNVAIPCEKLLVFSELSMLEHFQKETRSGRFPSDVRLLHAKLPSEIQARVEDARATARQEVSPSAS